MTSAAIRRRRAAQRLLATPAPPDAILAGLGLLGAGFEDVDVRQTPPRREGHAPR
ncbi:MAG: hypothetical protein H0T89_11675 [Deltaproteobacteria bacterium]|nr:hypothetical protein [Deltaproteobacteria bacterium]MDQ3298060.1 hypothetical protein [Myxococcota bacterium]